MEWVQQHFKDVDTFPRPNWDAIYEHVEKNHANEDKHELWCNIARSWMNKLITSLPDGYNSHESENFIILTTEDDKYVALFLSFLENAHRRILNTLSGIVSDEGYGKYVVLIFDDIDHYYSYISYFYSKDGMYGQSSGVYLNKGYGHFAFPHQELTYAETIAAHEMTHALLAHLPIPAWLNEGLAVSMENNITGSAPLRMSNERYARHQSFWGENEIQEFWSGDSFSRIDEGQELSYHLAQFAVNSLSQDYDVFKQFVNKADYADGGEAAAIETYEGSLGNLIAQYFGDGDWSPKPDNWQKIDSENK